MEGLSLQPALGNRLPILYPSTIPLYARLALSHNPHRRDYRLPQYHHNDSCSYKPTATFVEGGKTFLYIGIKSPHGEATGTAYFDDVYVLR